MRLLLVALVGGVSCAALSALAFEDLGPIEKARAEHPSIFVPGEVNILDIGGVRSYVYSGVAERYLEEETDSELWQEATLDAKKTLLMKLAGEKTDVEVSVSGETPLYQVKDGNSFLVVVSAPVKNVSTHKKSPPPAAQHSVAVPVKPVLDASPAETHETAQGSVTTVSPNNAPDARACATDGMSYSALREHVAENPDDWRARRQLGRRTIEGGNLKRGAKHLDVAVRSALRDADCPAEELSALVFETAQNCEAAEMESLALKYYRMVLHQKCSPDMRKKANAQIGRLMLRF